MDVKTPTSMIVRAEPEGPVMQSISATGPIPISTSPIRPHRRRKKKKTQTVSGSDGPIIPTPLVAIDQQPQPPQGSGLRLPLQHSRGVSTLTKTTPAFLQPAEPTGTPRITALPISVVSALRGKIVPDAPGRIVSASPVRIVPDITGSPITSPRIISYGPSAFEPPSITFVSLPSLSPITHASVLQSVPAPVALVKPAPTVQVAPTPAAGTEPAAVTHIIPISAVALVSQAQPASENRVVDSNPSFPAISRIKQPATEPLQQPIDISPISPGVIVSPKKQSAPTVPVTPASVPVARTEVQRPTSTTAIAPASLLAPPMPTPAPNGNSFSFMRLGGYGFDNGDVPQNYQLAPAKEMLPELVPAGVRVRTKSGIITSVRGRPGLYGIHPTPPPDPTHEERRPAPPPEIVYLNQAPQKLSSGPTRPFRAVANKQVPFSPALVSEQNYAAQPVFPSRPIVQRTPASAPIFGPARVIQMSNPVYAADPGLSPNGRQTTASPLPRQATLTGGPIILYGQPIQQTTNSGSIAQTPSIVLTSRPVRAEQAVVRPELPAISQQDIMTAARERGTVIAVHPISSVGRPPIQQGLVPATTPHVLTDIQTPSRVPVKQTIVSPSSTPAIEQIVPPQSARAAKPVKATPSALGPTQLLVASVPTSQPPSLVQGSRPARAKQLVASLGPRLSRQHVLAFSFTEPGLSSATRPVSLARRPTQRQQALIPTFISQQPAFIQMSQPVPAEKISVSPDSVPTYKHSIRFLVPEKASSPVPLDVEQPVRIFNSSRRRRPGKVAYKPLRQSITAFSPAPQLATATGVISPARVQVIAPVARPVPILHPKTVAQPVNPTKTKYLPQAPQFAPAEPPKTALTYNERANETPLYTPQFGQRIRPLTHAPIGPAALKTSVTAGIPLATPDVTRSRSSRPSDVSRQVGSPIPVVSAVIEEMPNQESQQAVPFNTPVTRQSLHPTTVFPQTATIESISSPVHAPSVQLSRVPATTAYKTPRVLLQPTVRPSEGFRNVELKKSPIKAQKGSVPQAPAHQPLRIVVQPARLSSRRPAPPTQVIVPTQYARPQFDSQPVVTAPLAPLIQTGRAPLTPIYKAPRMVLEPKRPSGRRPGPSVQTTTPTQYTTHGSRFVNKLGGNVALTPSTETKPVSITPIFEAPRAVSQVKVSSGRRLVPAVEMVAPTRYARPSPHVDRQPLMTVLFTPSRPSSGIPKVTVSKTPGITVDQFDRQIIHPTPYDGFEAFTQYTAPSTGVDSRPVVTEPQTPRVSPTTPAIPRTQGLNIEGPSLSSSRLQASKPDVQFTLGIQTPLPKGNSFSFMRLGGYGFDNGEVPATYQIAPVKEMLPELVPAGVRVRTKSGIITSVRGRPGQYGIHPTPPPDPNHRERKPAPPADIVYLKQILKTPLAPRLPVIQGVQKEFSPAQKPSAMVQAVNKRPTASSPDYAARATPNQTTTSAPRPRPIIEQHILVSQPTPAPSSPTRELSGPLPSVLGLRSDSISTSPFHQVVVPSRPAQRTVTQVISVPLELQLATKPIPQPLRQTVLAPPREKLRRVLPAQQVTMQSPPLAPTPLPTPVRTAPADTASFGAPAILPNFNAPTTLIPSGGGSGSYGNDVSDFEDFVGLHTQSVPVSKVTQIVPVSRTLGGGPAEPPSHQNIKNVSLSRLDDVSMGSTNSVNGAVNVVIGSLNEGLYNFGHRHSHSNGFAVVKLGVPLYRTMGGSVRAFRAVGNGMSQYIITEEKSRKKSA